MLAPDTDPAALAGLEIVDRRGERIGRVRQVYPEDGVLAWAGVRGNLIGTSEALVPLAGADLDDGVLTVPITRSRFLSAPRRTPDAGVGDGERDELRRFYDESGQTDAIAIVAPAPEPERAPEPAPAPKAEPAQPPTPEPTPTPVTSTSTPDPVAPTPDPVAPAPGAAVAAVAAGPVVPAGTDGLDRSEQRIRVATVPVPRTRVVLRKVVVTEQRTITVPVRREEVRLVREPIEDGEPVPGAVLEESDQELVLHEERVVVTTEVVPIERVRLVREVVTEQREVTGEVWREHLEPGEEPAPTS